MLLALWSPEASTAGISRVSNKGGGAVRVHVAPVSSLLLVWATGQRARYHATVYSKGGRH